MGESARKVRGEDEGGEGGERKGNRRTNQFRCASQKQT